MVGIKEDKQDKLIGRDKELKEIKDILDKEKCVVIYGDDGNGKSSMLRHIVGIGEALEYDNVFEISDFEFSPKWISKIAKPEDKSKFSSMKDYVSWCEGKSLIIIRNITHHSDAEIYETLSKQVPLDEDSIKKMRDDHHLIILRSQEFKELKHITHYHLKNIQSDDDCTLLLKEYLEIELTDTQLTHAKNITNGNPLFSKMLSRYINTVKKDAIDTLLEDLYNNILDAQNELVRRIIGDFKSGKYANLRFLSTFCWFGSFSMLFSWIEKIVEGESLNTDDCKIFYETMLYFGFWRQNKISGDEIIIEPTRSACKRIRENINQKSEYLNDFLITTTSLMPEDSELEYLILSRHIFYYFHSKEYFNEVQKARISLHCARALEKYYNQPYTALEMAEECLDVVRGSGELLENNAHRILAEINLSQPISNFAQALIHFRQVVKLGDAFIAKHKLKVNKSMHSSTLLKIGGCLDKLKKYDEALETFRGVLEMVMDDEKSPTYATALYSISRTYFHLNNYIECLHYSSQSIRVSQLYNHSTIDQYLHSAKCHYKLGNTKKSNYFIKMINELDEKEYPQKSIYLEDFHIYTQENPQALISASTKYIATSTILISVGFLLYKYLKK
ncbi:hypothetical protein DLAC_00816 [Tieghemostelium lacteum]|uniref:Uncharacterized protein n=1 Tax=Tieghemostelium lacteum TaxID=361077 RepID=A0A152A706_TIELA|nr:hypothetical protein DLAC_00816 [Tieghemostelium lacteum]|eukprot:KYR02022.1 hypothetical protein DLAC_00816 [Tieghemostelium lacteum]